MIYDFNTFRMVIMDLLVRVNHETHWTPMERMEIAAAVGRIEDAVAGRFAIPSRVLIAVIGLSCPRLPWRDGEPVIH